MRARLLRQFAILAITAGGVSAALVQPAAACSCAGEPEPSAALLAADVVFEGTVLGEPEAVRAQLGIDGYSGAARFRFAVARYFKGQQGSEAAIYTIDQESACGRSYASGSTYLVYGRLTPDGVLTDSLCSRTRPLANAAEDLALLGEGSAPDPSVQPRDVLAEQAEEEPGCSAAPSAGAASHAPGAEHWALSGVLLCALTLLRRRSARFSARR